MSPEDRYDIGISLLRSTNCVHGWDLYDLHPSRPVDRLRLPRWDGKPCPTLIIMAEQGFGDMLQFLRFIPHLNFPGELVVALHDELYDLCAISPLFTGMTAMRRSEVRTRPWPDGSRWERLLSLPVHLKPTAISPQGAYLTPPVSPRLPTANDLTTIGIAWRATHRRIGPNRSIPVGLLRRLAMPGRARLVSLHRDFSIARPHPDVLQPPIRNFADTAAVIGQCDIVVTADTVTAHLAPALGVPTLICLLQNPDWRWGTPERPTQWYADAELLFQPSPGDWRAVVATARSRIIAASEALT